jgi:nucleoid-associated protein YgaU
VIDRRSRYTGTPVLTADDGRGGTEQVLDLRPTPATTSVLSVVATDADRLDLLAFRYYRDPARFWRICDATTDLDPFDVLVPGRPARIPPDK